MTRLEKTYRGIKISAYCGASIEFAGSDPDYVTTGDMFVVDATYAPLIGLCTACAPEIARQRALKDALRTLLLQHGMLA